MPKDALTIDLKQVNKMAFQLRRMHRSAMPNVVRDTLNDTAFYAKKEQLKKTTGKIFTKRDKNFFKRFSGVKKAVGYDLRAMSSELGMSDETVASQNLKQQNNRGKIKKRAFMPLKAARTGGNNSRKISSANRLSKVNIVNSDRFKRGNKKSRIFKAVYAGRGTKKMVLHDGMLYKPKNIREGRKGLKFKLTPMYTYKKGRSIYVKKTSFLDKTALEARRVEQNRAFERNFKKQIKKEKAKGRL